MSWNNTVACGYCGHLGHNKRTCPDFKAVIDRRIAADPNDHYAKHLIAKRTQASIRRCTYCNKIGHNRRTCTELAQCMQEWQAKAASWRLKFINYVVESGIAAGALIKTGTGRYGDTPQVLVVKEFYWSTLNHETQLGTSYPSPALRCLTMKLTDNCLQAHLPKIPDLCGDDNKDPRYHGGGFEVIGPVPVTEALIVKSAPQWWLDGFAGRDGQAAFKKKFANRQSPNHYDNGFTECP